MNKFIIKTKTKVNGVEEDGYHQKISETRKSIGATNVYTEHITSDINKAKVFYDIQEAERVCNLFAITGVHKGRVVEI